MYSYSEPTSNRINKIKILPKHSEIRLTVESWTCALDYFSAVLNDWFLPFRYGPALELLSSESLCTVSTTSNQE
ncbi:hypothetical protein AYI68_g2466 [Smittium mucronatum]|uniref:Uncharacterized protein n=1 Tax=Smittium mucronatum TaxID=133383 RepID=A0A1R0H2N3_9FUNG|nr:hypothetical protein AYI68_g2466 [Smittium mucronatum]